MTITLSRNHIEDVLRRQTRRTRDVVEQRRVDRLRAFAVQRRSLAGISAANRQDQGRPAIVRQQRLVARRQRTCRRNVRSQVVRRNSAYGTAHIIGATGTGKSTLLFNLIRQDIENGEGVAVLDPHGDLIDRILGIIPPNGSTTWFWLTHPTKNIPVGFNILSAHSDLEKNLLASDLVAVFQRLSTSWGDQMNSVLQNAILAFLGKRPARHALPICADF